MSIDALALTNNISSGRFIPSVYDAQTNESFSIFGRNNKTFINTNTELTLEKAPRENMELIAHRGYSQIAPENTIPAFIAAANSGFGAVECDIQWTKDSVPVILHDSTINRTARYKNGWKPLLPKKCSNLNYQDLLNFDFGIWKGKEYEGTKIPTFSEFIDCCSEYNLKTYVELKQTSNFNAEKAEKLVDIVKQAGLEDKVTWVSFNADYLKIINELMPDCRLGYLSKETPSDKTIATLQGLKTEHNEVFLDVKSSAIDKKSSEILKDAGFSFEAWTVDNERELNILYEYDCGGITTNSLTENAAEK